MSEEPRWRATVDLLIPHPTHPQILVQQSGGHWRLPNALTAQGWGGFLGRITTEVQQQLGLVTRVVRELTAHSDEAHHREYFLYLVENQSVDWAPPDHFHWVGADALDQLVLAHPEQHSALVAHLHEMESGITPPQRALWEQPGWFRPSEVWINAQLTHLGTPSTGPVEQVKHSFLSCVLRAPTTAGWVYFKASNGSSLMVNEAVLTQALARRFPWALPQTLAIDPARDWMLLVDFGREIGWGAPVETRAAVLSAFGQLQLASADQVAELLSDGCTDRRLPKLVEQIEPLLTDQAVLALIDAEQQQRLLAAAPRLAELCTRMAEYQVPPTLVHGDLDMPNIAQRGEHFVFFDWSDACIAHPFVDTITILHEDDQALQARLRDAYLATWTRYEPRERLLELWQLAAPICALHQAVSYRYLAHHAETGCNHPIIRWAMPYWFGKILEAL